MDSSIRHVSDPCEPSFFLCSFNFSSLSSSRLLLFKNFRNSLWLSLFQPNMPQNLSPSHASKKGHQWCSGYLSTEEWMWTNSVSATHPNVIRYGNQIYDFFFFFLCDFFAKDHPFVSFIALKIIYFFLCFFFFYLFLNLIHLLLYVFEIFMMGMKSSTSRVCVCVNGQGLAGGDFVRLCHLMPMFGDVWLLGLSVPCVIFLFSFHEFQGEKKISCFLRLSI